MYVNTQRIRQPRFGALGRRRRSLGDGIDWSSIITTGINDAASVAKTAVTPPAYSSVVNPLTGQQSITAYGATGSAIAASPLGTTTLSSLLTSPLFLLFGFGLVAVIALRK